MPFKSQAQISPKTFEEWNRETGGKKLPDHVKRQKRSTRRTKKRKP
jgi:hypothetical protein